MGIGVTYEHFNIMVTHYMCFRAYFYSRLITHKLFYLVKRFILLPETVNSQRRLIFSLLD